MRNIPTLAWTVTIWALSNTQKVAVFVCREPNSSQLASFLWCLTTKEPLLLWASSTRQSLIFWPFQIFFTLFPVTVKGQHTQERNAAVWEVAELHKKSQAKPLHLNSVSDHLFPAIFQPCPLQTPWGKRLPHGIGVILDTLQRLDLTLVICSLLFFSCMQMRDIVFNNTFKQTLHILLSSKSSTHIHFFIALRQ